MTYPEQGPSELPPTVPTPYVPAQPAPAQPVYPPGVASVPQQPQGPAEPSYAAVPPGYPVAPGYPPPPAAYPGDPSYAGTPYAPPPKRRNGLILGIVAAVLVACLAGAAVGGVFLVRFINAGAGTVSQPTPTPAPGASTGDTQPSTQPPTGSTRSDAPAGSFTGDLRDLLVPRPSGAEPWEEFLSEDGTLTADELAELFVDESEMQDDLRTFHFRRGAVNHWRGDGIDVLIILFQFESVVDAHGYVEDTEDAGIQDYEPRGGFDGIPDSLFYADEGRNDNGQRGTISLTASGTMVSYVAMWHPGAIDAAGARALAVQQHAQLR